MKFLNSFGLCAVLLSIAAGCGQTGPDSGKADAKYNGLVLNEIAAHDEITDAVTWVEIVNSSSESKSLDGLSLYVSDAYFTDQSIATLSGSLAAGERLLLSTEDGTLRTGVASNAPFTLVLGTSPTKAADSYTRSEDGPSLGLFASYQRIPDATGEWRKLTYSSKGKANEIFDISKTKPTAVWTWGSHMKDLLANDAANLKSLKDKGYDHIILNFAAFSNQGNIPTAKRFMQKANELGLVVHVWMQAFYNGGWISPIDDTNKCFKEEIFASIREEAAEYIENWGVKGVHLDYIRFGGTASKHDHSYEVNSVAAVNRCCKEIREICDGFDEGLITSAALMPEPNSTHYYGQSPAQMSKYIHILMPMIYRYGSYNFSDSAFQERSNYFARQAAKGGGVSWSGIQTYNASTVGMSAEAMRKDIDLMAATDASGIVLFRYQLGTFPDVNDLWN